MASSHDGASHVISYSRYEEVRRFELPTTFTCRQTQDACPRRYRRSVTVVAAPIPHPRRWLHCLEPMPTPRVQQPPPVPSRKPRRCGERGTSRISGRYWRRWRTSCCAASRTYTRTSRDAWQSCRLPCRKTMSPQARNRGGAKRGGGGAPKKRGLADSKIANYCHQ